VKIYIKNLQLKLIKKNKMNKEKRKVMLKRTKIICFLFLLLFHLLDVISTIIGLQVGAREVNPIPAYFQSFGFFGWVFGTVFVIFVFVCVFEGVNFFSLLYKKIALEELPISLEMYNYIITSLFIIIGLFLVILNNISVIIELIN